MRRVLATIAGVILLGMLCVPAPSASAHDGHVDWFKWREPEEQSDVSGEKVNLRAKVQFQEGVDRWLLEVLPPDGYATITSWGTVCESTDADKKQKTVEISCEWNSAAYPDGKPSRNHAYRARVTAWNGTAASSGSAGEGGGGGASEGDAETTSSSSSSTTATTTDTSSSSSSSSSSSTSSSSSSSTSSTTTTTQPPPSGGEEHKSAVRTLVVANPPSAPNGVRLEFAEKTSQVTVSWDPNPEPDIAGYLVEERYDSGDWSLVAKPTATSWTGRLEKKGTYRFRVGAIRYVGSAERVKEGPRREPQSGMRKVEADPEKRTTESTQPGPASAGGKRKDQEEDKKKKEDKGKKDEENQKAPESTTSTLPPDSVTVTFDSALDPASTPSTGAAAGNGQPALSPIQPGSPGSVQTRYADPPRLPAPVSPEQAYDPGFSLALPYPKEVRLDIGPPPAPPPRLLGTVALFDSNEEQRRALVGVLAGGLVVFIISMQAAYLNRRPRPIDLAASTDWD